MDERGIKKEILKASASARVARGSITPETVEQLGEAVFEAHLRSVAGYVNDLKRAKKREDLLLNYVLFLTDGVGKMLKNLVTITSSSESVQAGLNEAVRDKSQMKELLELSTTLGDKLTEPFFNGGETRPLLEGLNEILENVVANLDKKRTEEVTKRGSESGQAPSVQKLSKRDPGTE